MYVCIGCGSVEDGYSVLCPKCGSEMRSERELAHRWVGRPGPNEGYALNCRDRQQTAFMESEIANELPYCPFCRKDIGYRPKNIDEARKPED